MKYILRLVPYLKERRQTIQQVSIIILLAVIFLLLLMLFIEYFLVSLLFWFLSALCLGVFLISRGWVYYYRVQKNFSINEGGGAVDALELRILRDKLKSVNGEKSKQYFLLLGPSNAGKTSLLQSSGLRFLNDKQSFLKEEVSSTRSCDVFETEQAVFIDTGEADCFPLFQEGGVKLSFSGVFLVFNLLDVLSDSKEVWQFKLSEISQNIKHFQQTMACSFPIFIFMTHCDGISGFDGFSSLLKESLSGDFWCFALSGEDSIQDNFFKKTEEAYKRLSSLRLSFLSKENIQLNWQLYNFPEEMLDAWHKMLDWLSLFDEASLSIKTIAFTGRSFCSGSQSPDGFLQRFFQRLFSSMKTRLFFLRPYA